MIEPVSESTDGRIAALLIWTYNFLVHRVRADAVVAHEELIFLVTDFQLCQEPKWSVCIKGFSILDQDDFTITFQISAD